MSDAVLFDRRDDGIVVVTLNDPKTRNALTDPLIDGIVEACRRINADMSVSCMILTGAGEGFSSGGNVKEMRDKKGLFGGSPWICAAPTSTASTRSRGPSTTWRCPRSARSMARPSALAATPH